MKTLIAVIIMIFTDACFANTDSYLVVYAERTEGGSHYRVPVVPVSELTPGQTITIVYLESKKVGGSMMYRMDMLGYGTYNGTSNSGSSLNPENVMRSEPVYYLNRPWEAGHPITASRQQFTHGEPVKYISESSNYVQSKSEAPMFSAGAAPSEAGSSAAPRNPYTGLSAPNSGNGDSGKGSDAEGGESASTGGEAAQNEGGKGGDHNSGAAAAGKVAENFGWNAAAAAVRSTAWTPKDQRDFENYQRQINQVLERQKALGHETQRAYEAASRVYMNDANKASDLIRAMESGMPSQQTKSIAKNPKDPEALRLQIRLMLAEYADAVGDRSRAAKEAAIIAAETADENYVIGDRTVGSYFSDLTSDLYDMVKGRFEHLEFADNAARVLRGKTADDQILSIKEYIGAGIAVGAMAIKYRNQYAPVVGKILTQVAQKLSGPAAALGGSLTKAAPYIARVSLISLALHSREGDPAEGAKFNPLTSIKDAKLQMLMNDFTKGHELNGDSLAQDILVEKTLNLSGVDASQSAQARGRALSKQLTNWLILHTKSADIQQQIVRYTLGQLQTALTQPISETP